MKFSKDLNLLLIHANGIPRTLRLSLSKLRIQVFFLLALSLLIFLLALGFSFIYIYQNFLSPRPFLTAKNAAKLEQVQSLEKIIEDLQDELARKKGVKRETSPTTTQVLHLFAPASEAILRPFISVKEASAKFIQNKVSLSFKLKNDLTNGDKVNGYIISLIKGKNFIRAYPLEVFHPTGNTIIKYNKGKFFSISRFVDINIMFTEIKSKEDLTVHLFIFSPTGKLLHSSHIKKIT